MPPSDAVEDEIFHRWFMCALSICLHRPELHQCYPFCCKHVERLPFWFLVLKLQQNSFFHAALHPGMEGGKDASVTSVIFLGIFGLKSKAALQQSGNVLILF